MHTVDANKTTTRKMLEIGQEDGRIIQPTGFDVAADGRFVVADVPRAQQRVQTFDRSGQAADRILSARRAGGARRSSAT